MVCAPFKIGCLLRDFTLSAPVIFRAERYSTSHRLLMRTEEHEELLS
jgi:hypothetical protein